MSLDGARYLCAAERHCGAAAQKCGKADGEELELHCGERVE